MSRLRKLVSALIAAGALVSAPAHADPITAIALVAQGVAVAGGATVLGVAISASVASYIAIGAGLVGGVMARRKAARAAAAAQRAAAREPLQERTLVLQSSEPPPQVIYGRGTVGGAVLDRISSAKTYVADDGTSKTRPDALQHVVIGLACHEITAVHRVHMLGEWIEFGADGWALGTSYRKTQSAHVTKQLAFVGGAATVPGVPAGSGVSLISITRDTGGGVAEAHTGATVSGFAISGGPSSGVWNVCYSLDTSVGLVRMEWHPGTETQAASDYLRAASTRWTADHRLLGIGYVVLTLDLDDQRFQGGLPSDLAFDVSGKPLLDPRTGITAYSDNTALAAYDWLRSPWGYGLAVDDISTASVIAAANACDVLYGGEKFSRVAGAFKTSDDRGSVLADLTENMGGFSSQGSVWSVHAGAWSEPVLDITDDDAAGPLQIARSATDHDEAFNSARATILAPGKTQTEDIDPYVNTAFVTADGRHEWQTFTLPFCPSKRQGRDLLRQFVEQSRTGMIVQYLGKMRLWPLESGDRVTLWDSMYQIVGKTFRVLDVTRAPGQPVALTLQEDIAATYDQADAADPDPAPNTSLPPPGAVDSPAGIGLSSGNATLLRLLDGSIVPRVQVSWTRPTGIYMTSPGARTEVEWRAVDESAWSTDRTVGDAAALLLGGVRDGAAIIVRVRHVNSFGSPSPWVARGHIVAGKSAAPTAPTALVVTEGATGQRIFSATHTPDLDHLGYIVRYSADSAATWPAMTDEVRWSGTGPGESAQPPDGTWRVAIAAEDTSGNVSSPVYATVTLSAQGAVMSGGTDNLVRQPVADATPTTWSAPVVPVLPEGSVPWTHALQMTARDALEVGNDFGVRGGEVLYCAADMTTWQLSGSYWMRFGVMAKNSAGGATFIPALHWPGGNGWTRLSDKITLPADAVTATPWVQIDDGLGGSAAPYPQAWISNMRIARAEAGATRGAPAGTYVGDQLAEQLVLTVDGVVRDDRLSRAEKPGELRRWLEIDGEQASLVTEANRYGLVAARDAYTGAVSALAAHLLSLVPPWDDAGQDTPIVPSTYRAAWLSVATARSALVQQINAQAGTRVFGAGQIQLGAATQTYWQESAFNYAPDPGILGGGNAIGSSGFISVPVEAGDEFEIFTTVKDLSFTSGSVSDAGMQIYINFVNPLVSSPPSYARFRYQALIDSVGVAKYQSDFEKSVIVDWLPAGTANIWVSLQWGSNSHYPYSENDATGNIYLRVTRIRR